MILEVDAVLGEASQENHFKSGCFIILLDRNPFFF